MSPQFSRLSISAVHSCANALRDAVFPLPENQFVGSEESLTRALCVSTPTLRQAARLLEHEQLLTIRRGIGGGYYTRRPDAQAVAHMAAIFLRTRNTSLYEAFEVGRPLSELAFQLACRNNDSALRAELAQLVSAHKQPKDLERELELDSAFLDLLARMTNNSVLLLMLRIFADHRALISTERGGADLTLPAEYFENGAKITAAILARNERAALSLLKRRLELMHTSTVEALGAAQVTSLRPGSRSSPRSKTTPTTRNKRLGRSNSRRDS